MIRQFIFPILWSLLAAIVIAVILRYRNGKKARQRILSILSKLDADYEDFIRKRITTTILHSNTIELDVDNITDESFTVLKPDMDALMSLINSKEKVLLPIRHSSPVFGSIAEQLNVLLVKYSKTSIRLSKEDVEKIQLLLKDSIRADITKRIVDLKMRE